MNLTQRMDANENRRTLKLIDGTIFEVGINCGAIASATPEKIFPDGYIVELLTGTELRIPQSSVLYEKVVKDEC